MSAKFAARGCRVLMMTEHDRGFTTARYREYREACAKASSDKIFVLPGIEYSDKDNRVHVLTWGPVPFLGENLPTREMLAKVRAHGGVAVLAHPGRKAVWKSFDPEWSGNLLGIEAWNRKDDGWAPSKTAPNLLRPGNWIPFVGLDFHTWRQSFPLTMALEMEGEFTEETVVHCLKSRRCHALAFGLPLSDKIFSRSESVLNVAEKARRTVASVLRSTKIFAPARKV